MYVCMYVYMYVCIYVDMHVCTYARMVLCMHVCMLTCVCLSVNAIGECYPVDNCSAMRNKKPL